MVHVKVSYAQREYCDKTFSLKDLENALFQMDNDKFMGLDGFPCEFHK